MLIKCKRCKNMMEQRKVSGAYNVELIEEYDNRSVTHISQTNGYFKTMNKMLHFVSLHKCFLYCISDLTF